MSPMRNLFFLPLSLLVFATDPISPDDPHARGSLPPAESVAPGVHDELPSHVRIACRGNEAGTGVSHCGAWVRYDAAQYASVQVNVDHRGCNIVRDAANEPSIAIDPTNPRKVVIGWRQFDSIGSDFRQAGYAYSHDGGHTWVFPGVLARGVFRSDPVLDAAPDGTIYYIGVELQPLDTVFRSLDGGLSWDGTVQAPVGDKPWMTIDKSEGVGKGNVYIRAGYREFCRSTNGGALFEDFSEDTPSVRYPTMSVGPEGTLYAVGEHPVFTKSTNAQDPAAEPTFDPLKALDMGGNLGVGPPNPGGLLGQIWVTTDHSDGPTRGNVYVLGSVRRNDREELDVNFIRSTDGGDTWTEKVRVNDDPEGNGACQWFGMISVAPNGRIDAAWNDTRNYLDAPEGNLCELYYSYSTDGGVTWAPNIPVSPMFDSYVGWPSAQRKLGDYYHMISDNLGVNVAYAATFNGEQDVYFLRIGAWDCNGNEVPDEEDIACGGGSTCDDQPGSYDCNGNGVPDECEYRGDFDGDGVTTLRDVGAMQRCFTGEADPIDDPCCRLFDLDEDDRITIADLPALERILRGP